MFGHLTLIHINLLEYIPYGIRYVDVKGTGARAMPTYPWPHIESFHIRFCQRSGINTRLPMFLSIRRNSDRLLEKTEDIDFK